MNLNTIANSLDLAQRNRNAVEQISIKRPITLDEAYAIQSILISKRMIIGHSYTGIKMGFTSKEKMKQMGVHDLIWGMLTSDMEYDNGGVVELGHFIHPRIEPEVAFLLEKDIDEHFNENNMRDYVSHVASALEIIDSRYKNFKFSLEDVVADNCSSSGYILGEWMNKDTNISNIPLQLVKDDEVIQDGNSENILGNPWNSFLESVRITAKYGHQHRRGDIVLAGAATAAQYMEKNSTYEWKGSPLSNITIHAK